MSFSADISAFVEKANGNIEKATRQALVLAAQNVIMRSPVGNPGLWKQPRKGYVGGRFRANWNFSVGSRDESTRESVDPTGAATLARITGQIASAQVGRVYFLANALPYAMPLEHGWSTQAPNGMVRLTAMDLPRQINEYAASLK